VERRVNDAKVVLAQMALPTRIEWSEHITEFTEFVNVDGSTIETILAELNAHGSHSVAIADR
jgi:hypothetical protein